MERQGILPLCFCGGPVAGLLGAAGCATEKIKGAMDVPNSVDWQSSLPDT